jgi:anti-sigma B factor antagonist
VPARVVLHAAHLTFCDSTGLSVLVKLADRVQRTGSHLLIDQPHPILARLLAVTGLDGVLDIQPIEGSIEPATG